MAGENDLTLDTDQKDSFRTRKRRRRVFLFAVLIFAAGFLGILMVRLPVNGMHPSLFRRRLCFYKHGFIDREYTGMAEYGGDFWFVKEGKTDPSFGGFVKTPQGWFLIHEGKTDTEFNGFVNDGVFCWYLQEGSFSPDAEGVFYGEVKKETGWWNVRHGQVVFGDDVVKKNRSWWRVERGRVNFSYDGIAENQYGKWYVSNGEVDFSGSGTALFGGSAYQVEKGRVMEEISSVRTRFIAHRGLSAQAPENTVRAFTEAGKAGFWGCETDVRETADHRFVIMHDDTFERMCGVSSRPGELTAEEIRKLRIISGKHLEDWSDDESALRVAFLEDYLEVCLQYDMVPVIEIKDSAQAQNETDQKRVRALFDTVKGIMGNREVIFISFDFESLRQLCRISREEQADHVSLQCLSRDPEHVPVSECSELGIGVDLYYKEADPPFISAMHEKNLEVNTWTVNDTEPVFALMQAGIDYVTTNRILWLDFKGTK